jgi:hypothetical protein
MRVIVALFKYVIGASFLIFTFALAFVLGVSLSGPGAGEAASFLGGMGIYFAFVLFASLILLTGVAAILVSAHDRLCDIAEALRERNARAAGDRSDGTS